MPRPRNPAQLIDDYLRGKKSPLAGYGAAFVKAGRRYGVDPMLMVAISGQESAFGKYGPTQKIHNPFGWGPHIPFASYEEAIDTVTRGLAKGYIREGRKTIPEISTKWAPVGATNDPSNLNAHWVNGVERFYAELGSGKGAATGTERAAAVAVPAGVSRIEERRTERASRTSAAMETLKQMEEGTYDPVQGPTDFLQALVAETSAALPQRGASGRAAGNSFPAAAAPAAAPAKGFTTTFGKKLNAFIAASGGKVTITSGFRTRAEQDKLWRAAIRKYGSAQAARKWVAPPGRSNHNKGTAADLGGDLEWAHENAAKFGLHFPMPWEDWHIEG